jgi:hypothetical protein
MQGTRDKGNFECVREGMEKRRGGGKGLLTGKGRYAMYQGQRTIDN